MGVKKKNQKKEKEDLRRNPKKVVDTSMGKKYLKQGLVKYLINKA